MPIASLLGLQTFSDDFNICTRVPHLWSVLAVPPERQNIPTCCQRLRNHHTVLPKPLDLVRIARIRTALNIHLVPLITIDICGPHCSFPNKRLSPCGVSDPSVRSIKVQMPVLEALFGDAGNTGRGHFAKAVCISTFGLDMWHFRENTITFKKYIPLCPAPVFHKTSAAWPRSHLVTAALSKSPSSACSIADLP